MTSRREAGEPSPLARRSWRLAAIFLPLLVVAGLADLTPRLGANATGCSRIDNTRPGSSGGNPDCLSSLNQTCYYCESSFTGGSYEICAENVDGTIRVCQSVEQLPGRHPVNQR